MIYMNLQRAYTRTHIRAMADSATSDSWHQSLFSKMNAYGYDLCGTLDAMAV